MEESEPDLRHRTVLAVLDAIGSEEPSSGAGIAAALTLALATACALKAVKISVKHRADADLDERAARLQSCRDRALDRAREESLLFEKYLEEHEPRDAARLVVAAEEFQALAREIATELEDLGARVRDSVATDVTAAKALHSAAVTIEGLIMRSNRQLRARATP